MIETRIAFELPIRLVSELNNFEHWTVKSKRKKVIETHISLAMRDLPQIEFPCHVDLIRIAPRSLDEVNLLGALKKVQDSVADKLKPGLAPGRADGSKDITWSFQQRKGKPKTYALRVEISW